MIENKLFQNAITLCSLKSLPCSQIPWNSSVDFVVPQRPGVTFNVSPPISNLEHIWVVFHHMNKRIKIGDSCNK